MARKSELLLNNPPTDTISSIKFYPYSNQFLLVSSWDCSVRLFDTAINRIAITHTQSNPVLDCEFMGHAHFVSGGLDNTVKLFDMNSEVETIVGAHDEPVKSIEYSSKLNGILSGSWDRTIKIWDVRQKECVGTYEQSKGKVYSMSVVEEKIAVATSERRSLIWDLRNMNQYLIRHILKHQPRSIKISPNKTCYVIGSYDGRVAVEYIKRDPEVRKLRYAFKCHRKKVNNTEYVYRVNDISFHPYNTFATGGSNGFVNIWDGLNKKRLFQYRGYDASIASLAFSQDGKKLAVACSDLNIFERPKDEIPAPNIYVRYVSEQKVKPKNC